MQRPSSSTKLNQVGIGGQTSSYNNNLDEEELLDDEEVFNLTNKLSSTQREILKSPSHLKIDDYEDRIVEKSEQKIIFGESKSGGGSFLMSDRYNMLSRDIQLQQTNSLQLLNPLYGQVLKETKSLENNVATSTLHLDVNKPSIKPQNSVIMSENNIVSPKGEETHPITKSIVSYQNQGQSVISPGLQTSQSNSLSPQPQYKFANILKKHKITISKSGTMSKGQKEIGLFRHSTTKDGFLKVVNTMQISVSALKKKKTLAEKVNSWNIMGKILVIIRFMKALKQASIFHKFSNLKSRHYQIIGDKSHIDKDERENVKKKNSIQTYNKSKHLNNLKKLGRYIKVFQPDNIWILLFYNVVILSLTIITAFYETILSSFNNFNGIEITNQEYEEFRKLASTVFFLEILIRFNTATYREGIVIFNREFIIKNYVRLNFFWVDITVAIALVSSIDDYIFNLVIFILRCVKIYRLAHDLNDHFRIWYRFPTGWILTKLFFMIITLAHFWGCQFHYLGRLENEAGLYSWLQRYDIVHDPWYIKYINSFYFSTISMITIGYGDIVPVTCIEKCYATFVAVLGSCFFSYIVNTIGSIFQEISNKEAAFKQQKNNVTDYMAKRNINQKLQLKVIKYLDYTHTRSSDGPLKGQTILNSIAKNLREEVQLEYFGNILQNTQLFSKNFSVECLRALSLKLKEVMYGPGEVIFHKGELDHKIFFIQSGEVSLYIEKDGDEIFEMAKLIKGQMFGQFGFFGNKPREISVRCCDITHLVYLDNEDFISVIKNYQDDYENYNMIKDEINFKDKKLSTICSSCGSFEHTIVECSLVTPYFNKFRIMIKHIYPVEQKRQAVIRERVKFHTYQKNYPHSNLSHISIQAAQYKPQKKFFSRKCADYIREFTIVRDDLKKVRNSLAQKFMQYGDVDEVSDENGDSDGEFENQQKQSNPIDDKEYFLKQKMQFRYVDGEMVNFESENTHNYITDDQQSQMADTLNQTSQTNTLQLENAQTFGHKDSLMDQLQNKEQIPDIVVQRKELKQLSIIKNTGNPYFRSNSIAQKQSLFRMESLAALSSDLQKEDAPSRELINAQRKQYPINGGFASATGQTPKYDSQIDNQYQSDYKSQQDFQTQGIYENTSNLNSINHNTSPRTGQVIGNEYLTQYNIGYVQNTLESTPFRSVDQSLDDNQNTLNGGQQQIKDEQKKSSLTSEQLQQVRQKLQMLNEKKKKRQNSKNKIRKKKVSIQIEGKVLSQENDSSKSYLNEDDDEEEYDDCDSSSQIDNTSKILISEFNNYKKTNLHKQKSYMSKESDKQSQTNIKTPKNTNQQYNTNQANNIVIIEQDKNDEELDKVDDDIKQKINKKIMEYQGEKILERKSEQSMQEIEISSMSLANNQLFTSKSRDANFNYSQQQTNHILSPKNKGSIDFKSTNELKIDIDTLNKYDSESSQSNRQTKLKNSKFSSFYKDKNSSNKDSIDINDEIINSQSQKLQQKPSLLLDKKREHEQEQKEDEKDDPITEERFNTEDHPTPVKTPTHRRLTSKAEKLFGQQHSLDQQQNYQSQDSPSVVQSNTLIEQDPLLQNQQKNNSNKKNFLQLNGGQLAPVQEMLTKYSNEDMQNASPLDTRKLSIQSENCRNFINEQKQQQKLISDQKVQNKNNINQNSSQSPRQLQLSHQRQSFNYFKDVNNTISNNSNLFQNTQPDIIDPSNLLKKYPVSIPTNFQEQFPLQFQKQNNNIPEINKLKEHGQLHRQLSLNFTKKNNYNNTTDMRKIIAYNKANSKHFNPSSEEHLQGYNNGIYNIQQGTVNHQQKQHISQKGATIRMKNQNVNQNHGIMGSPQYNNNHIPSYTNIPGYNQILPHTNMPGQRQNFNQTFFGDSFSQQLLFHQKYFQGKNKVRDNNQQQLQGQLAYQGIQNDSHHMSNQGQNTPKKRQPTIIGYPHAKGQQFNSTFSQINSNNNNSNSHSNYNSFGNNTRGRVPSWGVNNLNQNNIRMKTDSQINLPPADDMYYEDVNEYETVSNADLYIYDFDTMKEYKKYYPQYNYKKVIGGLRTRKPFIQNKSIHNNSIIQKIVQKKKMIPRSLQSLKGQFDYENDKKID